jgi:hypothetical protein
MFRGGSPASGNAAITGGTAKFDDGLVGSPSIAFASIPTTGFFLGSSRVRVTIGGTEAASWDAQNLYLASNSANVAMGAAVDAIIGRTAAATLQISGSSNAAATFNVSAGNGGFISNVKSVTESLTIAAAATTVSATSIPAGAILLGVAVRVTTVIPTAATFTITTTVGGTTLNTAAVSTAATSTDPGTAAGASYRAAATTVTITPNLTPGAATGVVRLQYYYLQVTPPTS